MHHLNPTLVSSDEGAESGDDSEEDLVTNYIVPSSSAPGHPQGPKGGMHPHLHKPPMQLPLHQPPSHGHHSVIHSHQYRHRPHPHHGMGVHPAHNHGQPRRLVRMAEIPTMDSMSTESLGLGVGGIGGAPSDALLSSIPVISITPNSPIGQKPLAVFDQTLLQLKILQNKVQKMREATAGVRTGRELSRLSSSCPSLNVDDDELEGGEEEDPSSWSEEFLLDVRKGIRVSDPSDPSRRRSWCGLSDEEKKRSRQRSVSLSSLDSDNEEPFYDVEVTGSRSHSQGNVLVEGLGRRGSEKQRSFSGSSSPVAYSTRSGGGSSTHSLNEAHFEEKKPKAEKPRLLTPRLTLQKSVSTPSILAGINNQQAQKQPQQLNYQYDDDTSSKRRKRGSIFFRKKKDKTKKSSHQFVSVCYSISRNCDVCSKPLTNKPALRCESCLVCVHEHSCRDQISDCSKLKNPKVAQKHYASDSSNVSLSSTTKSASLGSSSNATSRTRQPTAFGVYSSSSPTKPYTSTGSNKVYSEERDVTDNLQDATADATIMDVNSASMESLDDALEASPESVFDPIDNDPELRLLDSEPEFWVNTVEKEVVKQLTEKQVKRQEHIYELIITEKHHCRMLKIMKRLFAEGMRNDLGMKDALIKSIFPCLDELITIHLSFLWRLRERQRMGRYISTIGDLLLEQFVADNSQGLKDAYGLFCSSHQDAVTNYKDLLKTDRRFQSFIRTKSGHPLMKKKGLPECILFVTHRVTKYPLMIEAIAKYTKEQPEETENLKKALEHVKEILVNINAQVAEKEKRQRLLEVYNKVDAKSSTVYKNHKIKKSDLLTDGRKLTFEGQATLSQQRGKPLAVSVIVMTDMIFFLQENNQKYTFVSPDNKAGAIPLCKLLVREKAGDSRSIYLISGNQNEMFELECLHPKDKRIWLESIRDAVEKCPEDEFGNGVKKMNEANADRIHEMLVVMQHQDKELAKICEDKMKMVMELVSALGGDLSVLDPPTYRLFLEENNLTFDTAKKLQISSIQEAMRLVGSASGWGTNLARSVSSVGEHQSDAYVSPSIPKRAETFGGFDNPNKDTQGAAQQQLAKLSASKKKKDSKVSLLSTDSASDAVDNLKNRRPSAGQSGLSVARASPDNLSVASATSGTEFCVGANQQHQQTHAAQLIQCLNTALVLSHHHITQYEMCRAQLATGSSAIGGRFSHAQKLEELRNLQEQISMERSQWIRERDHHDKWTTDKREELRKLQDSLKLQQEDVNQQRDDLYRKLQSLHSQGIVLNPLLTVLTSTNSAIITQSSQTDSNSSMSQFDTETSPSPSTGAARARPEIKHRNSTVSLPGLKRDAAPSLATQQKGVKQQLPMKLAKLGSAGSSSNISTSSLSSSMSSSLGGIASPSMDREGAPRGMTGGAPVPHTSPPSVQQMLPLRLSEKTGASGVASRSSGQGYQRLPSPPLPPSDSPGGAFHQRTGSSPSSFHNGSSTAAASSVGIVGATGGDNRVLRNTTSTALITSNRVAVQDNSLPGDAGVPPFPGGQTGPPSNLMAGPLPPGAAGHPGGRSGQPGQRIKDPDTDQDIIFF